MPMDENIRAKALQVLQNVGSHSRQDVYNAVLDLRRNPKPGDESLLVPLLEYDDDMIVAATLFALTNVYGNVKDYRGLIMKLAKGDPRDTGEMPIQAEAIEGLADLAPHDPAALKMLWQIAEHPTVAECPRSRAWQCLARLYGVDWQREDTETMVWDPASRQSEEIRQRIRVAAANADGQVGANDGL